MRNKKPPFEITNAMIDHVAEIAELVGRLTSTNQLSANPTLRRTNRIRTIHGSLAIEQNTLTLEQVTAVLNGKQVLAPPKDIAEVKNAYEIYERLDELNPFSVDDLLTAHSIMTRGLVDESGVFRSKPVGVVDQEGHILHFGTLPQYVPDLVMELLGWTKNNDVHMLICSCVFHYEFELIHPFADGNGRVGRLWHTLLLSRWNLAFAWLPVESIIHDRQQEYYAAINASNEEEMIESLKGHVDRFKQETQCKNYDIALISFEDTLLIPQNVEKLSSLLGKKMYVLKNRQTSSLSRSIKTDDPIILSDPYNVNGLEFKCVILFGVDEGRLPQNTGVSDISANYIKYIAFNQLYLASSRAKYRLILIGNSLHGVSSCLQYALESGKLETGDQV